MQGSSTGLIGLWLRVGSDGIFLWTPNWLSGIHNRQGTSWLHNRLSDYHDGLWFMELVIGFCHSEHSRMVKRLKNRDGYAQEIKISVTKYSGWLQISGRFAGLVIFYGEHRQKTLVPKISLPIFRVFLRRFKFTVLPSVPRGTRRGIRNFVITDDQDWLWPVRDEITYS